MPMLPNVLTGAALRWGNAGNLTLQATAFPTGAIAVGDVQQVNLLLNSNYTAGTIRVTLQWSPDATNWFFEGVDSIGAAAGNQQSYAWLIKRWLIDATLWAPSAVEVSIPRPVCAHFLRVNVSVSAAIVAADFVQLSVERQQQGQIGGVGS
jgi:hypothetical protein